MMKKERNAVSRHGNVNPGTVFWRSKMSPLKARGRYIVADLLFGSISLFVFGLKWLKLSPTVTKSVFLFISIINRKITRTSFRGVLWGAEWCLHHMPRSCWGGKNKNCTKRKLELAMIVLSLQLANTRRGILKGELQNKCSLLVQIMQFVNLKSM